MRYIQSNLKKINLFWSESESSVKSLTEDSERKDFEKAVKSILVSGIGFSFLSWLGFLLQLMVMVSLRFLAVRRIERKLFEGDISKKELSETEIKKYIEQQ